MNIYELNLLTKKNILFYQEEDPLFIFYRLLKDNVQDAIILYELYKWKYIYCTNPYFLNWIQLNSIKIELTEESIQELLQNGDKEVLDYIDPKDYLQFILLSNTQFIKYILENYSIIIEKFHLIQLINEGKKDLYNKFLILLSYFTFDKVTIIDCIYFLCKSDELLLIKHLIRLYPIIIKQISYIQLFFFNSITYNNVKLSVYLLSIEPRLLNNIETTLLQLFIKNCDKTIKLLYNLNKKLFSNINHNYIFEKIASNKNLLIVDWYLYHFKNKLDKHIYELNIKKLILNGYIINDIISDEYFIHACSNNYIDIVRKYNYNYSIIEKGFKISAFLGYLDIVNYLGQFIEKNALYKILHNLIEVDTIHIHIVKYIYKEIEFYPPKLIKYLCKNGDIEFILDKELDEECIHIILKNGHFSLFYYLYMNNYIEPYNISDAFVNACETGKGLFIAKWLYYNKNISKNTIHIAFYNSSDIHTLKWLYSIEYIPITQNNNAYFIERCLNYDLDIVDWLCDIFPNYSYYIINGVIEYNINLFKVFRILEKKECSICFEINSDSMSLCNHSFCYDCINKWYKKNNSCPICRETLDKIYHNS